VIQLYFGMENQIVFVKAKSRLGLIHPPKGESNPDIGVENGSDSVLSQEFIQQFPHYEEITFEFTPPERVSLENYYQVLATEYQNFAAQIKEKLNTSKLLVTVGGDHSIALGSIAAILHIFNPATTGVIMIDSHGDIHQPSTSPSGNFHGMWLRPIIDTFEVEKIDNLIPQKLPPQNLFYIGNLDIEKEEREFMIEHQIDTFAQTQIGNLKFFEYLKNFIKTREHIHISFDIDVFNHSFAPATGMMIEHGLTPNDIFPILGVLKKAQSLSIDVVEVNPTLEGHEKTIQLAQKILTQLFSFKEN
jgi:arginase